MLDGKFEIVRSPRIFNQAYSPLTLVQGKRERPRGVGSSTAAERSGASLIRPELEIIEESPPIRKEGERPRPMVKANDKKQNPIDLTLAPRRTDRKETEVIKTQQTQKDNRERLHKKVHTKDQERRESKLAKGRERVPRAEADKARDVHERNRGKLKGVGEMSAKTEKPSLSQGK